MDVFGYLKKNYGLSLVPLGEVNNITNISSSIITNITGNHGVLFELSKTEMSIYHQLYSKLKNTEIKFNETADYRVLSKKYDYVIIATGNPYYTIELGCWRTFFRTIIKGATVLGDFDNKNVTIWVNKKYCKNGYAYLAPFDKNRASLVLVVDDISEKDIHEYWKFFLYYENIKYNIIQKYVYEHRAGFVYPHIVDNIYFVGISGGAIEPFLGFGLFEAMEMGILAAYSICTGSDYEKLLRPIVKSRLQNYELRLAYNNLSNKELDLFIAATGFPGIKHILYKTHINVRKYLSYVCKLYNYL